MESERRSSDQEGGLSSSVGTDGAGIDIATSVPSFPP